MKCCDQEIHDNGLADAEEGVGKPSETINKLKTSAVQSKESLDLDEMINKYSLLITKHFDNVDHVVSNCSISENTKQLRENDNNRALNNDDQESVAHLNDDIKGNDDNNETYTENEFLRPSLHASALSLDSGWDEPEVGQKDESNENCINPSYDNDYAESVSKN